LDDKKHEITRIRELTEDEIEVLIVTSPRFAKWAMSDKTGHTAYFVRLDKPDEEGTIFVCSNRARVRGAHEEEEGAL